MLVLRPTPQQLKPDNSGELRGPGGHATLATAHALWEDGADEVELWFDTRSGWLTARHDQDLIWLDFPELPATQVTAKESDDVATALGVTPRWIGRNRGDYLVELAGEAQVRQLRPERALLRELAVSGVIVTAPGDGEHDFVSRYFAPADGLDEDPVTGSAHCCLGPYWGHRLGKLDLLGYQASQRGGHVRVRLADSRVLLGGRAVTVLHGRLSIG